MSRAWRTQRHVSPSERANPPVALRRATATMAVGTLVSRITGVGRIVALGYALGTGLSLASPADAYNLSNTIPNIVQDLVLGGVLSATFIPVFVARLATRDEDDAWEAISAVVSVTIVVLGIASVIFLASGASDRERSHRSASLPRGALGCDGPSDPLRAPTRLLHVRRPRSGFVECTREVCSSDLRADREQPRDDRRIDRIQRRRQASFTAGPAVRPLRPHPLRPGHYRRCGSPGPPPPSLSAPCRTAASFPVRLPTRGGSHDHPIVGLDLRARVREPDIPTRRPRTLRQDPRRGERVHLLIRVFPTAVRGRGDLGNERGNTFTRRALGPPRHRGFRRRWATGLRGILAIVLPAAAGELILAKPLVAVLLGYHASSPAATTPTAQALAMLSLGLPGFCVFLYAVRGFQAMQNLRTAFWLYVFENVANVGLAVVLVGPLGIRGVALSISIAYTAAAALALFVLRSRMGGLDWAIVSRPFGRVMLATIALVAAAAIGSNLSASQEPLGLAARVVTGVVFGSVAYIVVVFAVGMLEQQNRRGARRR